MAALSQVLLAGAVWVGTAQVFVMNWEGGGEHPYRSDFTLRYREGAAVVVRDAHGAVAGRRVPLLPERIELEVWHQVRGLLNCVGTGGEDVTDKAEAVMVMPLRGRTSYQLVLPRSYGAYACGQGQRNPRDARAGVGGGLFQADLEFDDEGPRYLGADGQRMQGSYTYVRRRSADGSATHLVTKEITVKWDLRREIGP